MEESFQSSLPDCSTGMAIEDVPMSSKQRHRNMISVLDVDGERQRGGRLMVVRRNDDDERVCGHNAIRARNPSDWVRR